MPKINYLIPEQNFEKIAKQVGVILALELPVQYPDPEPTVWYNRIVPFDTGELPVINVIYGGSRYPSKDRESRDSNDTIFIDVDEKGISTDTNRGDALAADKLNKLLGKIAYILESTEYETLGFPLDEEPQIIRRTQVESINIFQQTKVGDNNNVVSGRVTFRVDAIESSILQAATPAAGYSTAVKLDLTDKGYQFIINNVIP